MLCSIRMQELASLSKDRGLRQEVKVKLVKTLVKPVVTYGAEAWTIKKADENRIEAMEMWRYLRMLRIRWTDKRTNISILEQLNVKRELLRSIKRRKLRFYGHAYRSGWNRQNCHLWNLPRKEKTWKT